MSTGEILYIGVPIICLATICGLLIGALCATAKNADAHLEVFEQARVADEFESIRDRYEQSVN